MDPNETLKRLRELLGGESSCSAKADGGLRCDDWSDVQELFQALDQWLSKGGFLPKAWLRLNPPAPHPASRPILPYVDNPDQRCKHENKQPPHPCPFSLDVYGNNEDLCTCCEECTQECADDI